MRRGVILLALLIPKLAFAEDFIFNAYIDGSYNYLTKSNNFTSGVYDRVFDIEENGFTLHQAAVSIGYEPDGFGGLINIIAGADANIIAPYGYNPYYFSQTFGIVPEQVYLSYKRMGWKVIAGLFDAKSGVEEINPTKDFNFSRSILFGYAEPLTFLGARASYEINGQLNMFVGINNGWNTIRDFSRRRTSEAGIVYRFGDSFSLAVTEYNGAERAAMDTASGPISIRNLVDMVFTYNFANDLTFILALDYGKQPKAMLPDGSIGTAIWQGSAAYLNYHITDEFIASLRGEIFEDKNGFRTGVVQTWKEITLSVSYSPIKSMVLRGEVRRDFSSSKSFVNANGLGSSSNNQSYAIEGFYSFGG